MIYDKLFDWQKKIVDKFCNRSSFGIYLDMGLGKTPISLSFAEKNNCSKILIITINSKAEESLEDKGSWFYWSNMLNCNPIIISKKTLKKKKEISFKELLNGNINNPLVYITNYESLFSRSKNRRSNLELKEDIKEFIKCCSNQKIAIIIDESHKMKDASSMQTKSIMKIKSEINIRSSNLYLYLLSGTPFTTGYIDLFSQLKFLGYDETKSDFTDRFCIRGNIPGLLGWQQPIIGYKNINKLYELIHRYALTMKSEDVVDLPEKVFVDHILNGSIEMKLYTRERINNDVLVKYIKDQSFDDENEKKEILNKYKNESIQSLNPYYRNIDYPSSKWMADTTGSLWLRARELSIGFQGNAGEYKWYHKNRLKKLAQFLEENPDNYLIFYNYTPELFEIFQICEELNYNIDVYCGEIKSLYNYNFYNNQTESEQLNNKKNVILANFASGSTGMNWQAYNKCIIFSLPLYKDYEQGIKRIHRIGQKETVIYHIFYENNWLDRSMMEALKKQIDYSDKMFDSDFKKESLLKEGDDD